FVGTPTLTVPNGTIVKASGANVTLADDKLTVGANSASLSSVSTAELTAAGDSTLDASGFSGKVTLVAGTGNDTLTGAVGATAVTTFVFDDGFGNDIINAQTGNKDVLDFTAFSDLSKLTVSGDKKVITDTTTNPGHTITQNTDTGHAIV